MKNKFNRFIKNIKNFFTSKNNKVVKKRRLIFGILIAAAIITTAITIIGSSAYKNKSYASTVTTQGQYKSSETSHHIVDSLNEQNYSVKMSEIDAATGKEKYYYIYTQSIKDGTITKEIYSSSNDVTYKSVTNDNKTTYSSDSKSNITEDEILGYIEGLNPYSRFHNYLHSNGVNCYELNGRLYFINNINLDEAVYLYTGKNNHYPLYAEIENAHTILKYTFEFK